MNRGSLRPRFAVSSRSSPLLGCDDLLRVADGAAIDGIDLDLTGSSLRRRFAHADRLPRLEGVLSLWLSPTSHSCADSPVDLKALGQSVVIVDEEKGSAPNGKRQHATAVRLREVVPVSTRVALAVRPRNPDAGRAHLSRLSLLRNLAEEWDLDLALDLSGSVDWLWEAEAAVSRLASRLAVLRVMYPLSTLDGHTRSRLTQRTLAASIDAGFDGVIAVVCHLPFGRWGAPTALERSARIAVDGLGSRYGIVPVWPRFDVPQRSSTP